MESMAGSDEELKKQLMEAGEKLLDPSVEELLLRLDRIEDYLSRIKQEYSDSMTNALSPLLKVLAVDKLLKHSDVDVKVAVAACMSKIMRITSPNLLRDDDQMKEVFHLIVSSFKNLDDNSSRSYAKRTSILENMANIESFVVMLDLECHTLITEMFQHFLKSIREHHPGNVFKSMENIMTRVLVESNVISPDLLSLIIDYVEKDDKILEMSRKLAEQVLRNSVTKVVPYLAKAVKSSGLIGRCKAHDEKVAELGQKEEQRTENKGKQLSYVKPAELSNPSHIAEKTESGAPTASRDGRKNVLSSTLDLAAKTAAFDENEKETAAQTLLSNPLADETANATSPSRSKSFPDVSFCKKTDRQKKNVSLTQNAKPSTDIGTEVASEEPSSLEGQLTKYTNTSDKTEPTVPTEKTEKSTSEAKPAKQLGTKVAESDSVQESSKPKEDKKRQAQGKVMDENGSPQSSLSENERASVPSAKVAPKLSKDEEQQLEEISKTSAKRKRSPRKKKVKAFAFKVYGENLVGSRIKVWCPRDRVFYGGVVGSYDAVRKGHLVFYDIGDQEIVNLVREKWEFIEDESESHKDSEADQAGHGAMQPLEHQAPKRRKAKTGKDESAKQVKTVAISNIYNASSKYGAPASDTDDLAR